MPRNSRTMREPLFPPEGGGPCASVMLWTAGDSSRHPPKPSTFWILRVWRKDLADADKLWDHAERISEELGVFLALEMLSPLIFPIIERNAADLFLPEDLEAVQKGKALVIEPGFDLHSQKVGLAYTGTLRIVRGGPCPRLLIASNGLVAVPPFSRKHWNELTAEMEEQWNQQR